MIPQYVLACVGIDILVRMLELSCLIGYSTSSLNENLKYYYYKTYTQCNLTDLKEWITKFLYMLLMYCVKTNNETEKDHCILFNELTVF